MTSISRLSFCAALCVLGYAACSSRTQASHEIVGAEGGSAGQNAGGASGGSAGSETAGSSGVSSPGGSSGSGAGGADGMGDGGQGGEDCSQDADGDGFTACDDCCDSLDDGCDDPTAVVPGGVEFPNNGFDDDCNDAVDEERPTCDEDVGVDPTAEGFAQALEICRTTSEAEPPWGLIFASFARADGTGSPVAAQHAVRNGFGAIAPRAGSRLVILSTGAAAATDDAGFTAFEEGLTHNTASNLPADWLAANDMQIPQPAGCPGVTETPANDPVLLQLQLRVPPNARAFAVDAFFLSSDYPEYVCSPYADYFLALLDSEYAGTPANPADKNVAIVTLDGAALPFSANFAYGSTGLFQACANGGTGCSAGAMAGVHTACTSSTELAGTGFDTAVTACNSPTFIGGGTGWRRIGGNVVPGEVMTLRLVIWDHGDGTFDSVVLLDHFEWLPNNVTIGAL